MEGPFSRGEVVWGTDPFKTKDKERPFLVLTNQKSPFSYRQFRGVAISTTKRQKAYELTKKDWYIGKLPIKSYVYPWLLITRDNKDISEVYGR